jgi:glutamate racemase
LLRVIVPAEVGIVDSAESTARVVSELLQHSPDTPLATEKAETGFKFFVTDSVEKFRRLGPRFLGHAIKDVQHVDLRE